jgi:hypothetical protein
LINENTETINDLKRKLEALDRRVVSKHTTYENTLASHSRAFKDLKRLIENDIIPKLSEDY